MLAWEEYASLEPFGPMQEDYRAARIWEAVLASSGSKPPDYWTFFDSLKPQEARERERTPQTPKEIVAAMRSWTIAMKGTINE